MAQTTKRIEQKLNIFKTVRYDDSTATRFDVLLTLLFPAVLITLSVLLVSQDISNPGYLLNSESIQTTGAIPDVKSGSSMKVVVKCLVPGGCLYKYRLDGAGMQGVDAECVKRIRENIVVMHEGKNIYATESTNTACDLFTPDEPMTFNLRTANCGTASQCKIAERLKQESWETPLKEKCVANKGCTWESWSGVQLQNIRKTEGHCVDDFRFVPFLGDLHQEFCHSPFPGDGLVWLWSREDGKGFDSEAEATILEKRNKKLSGEKKKASQIVCTTDKMPPDGCSDLQMDITQKYGSDTWELVQPFITMRRPKPSSDIRYVFGSGIHAVGENIKKISWSEVGNGNIYIKPVSRGTSLVNIRWRRFQGWSLSQFSDSAIEYSTLLDSNHNTCPECREIPAASPTLLTSNGGDFLSLTEYTDDFTEQMTRLMHYITEPFSAFVQSPTFQSYLNAYDQRTYYKLNVEIACDACTDKTCDVCSFKNEVEKQNKDCTKTSVSLTETEKTVKSTTCPKTECACSTKAGDQYASYYTRSVVQGSVIKMGDEIRINTYTRQEPWLLFLAALGGYSSLLMTLFLCLSIFYKIIKNSCCKGKYVQNSTVTSEEKVNDNGSDTSRASKVGVVAGAAVTAKQGVVEMVTSPMLDNF